MNQVVMQKSIARGDEQSRFESNRDVISQGVPARRFIPELHGLRGLALSGVVLFHLFGAGRVSGGIDIFLAISGFLFTGMLLREATATGGKVNLRKYYSRLIRRIVIPAAIVVVAIVVLFSLFSPLTKHRQMWAEARASLLYFENIELIHSQLAYGAAGPETSPFQHFWSLSVQGQFYLVWPIVIIFAVMIARILNIPAARVTAYFLAIAFISSFVYAIYLGQQAQAEAYLSTLTRSWQLAFGAGLALVYDKVNFPRAIRLPMGWIGLGMIISCGFIFDGASIFPGPWALWPLIGLAMVLLSGNATGKVSHHAVSATSFLSNKVLGWIGDISYGLYLWHWPILIFYMEIRSRDAIGIRGAVFILCVSILMAILLNRLIERPMKSAKSADATNRAAQRNLLIVALTGMIVFGSVATWYTKAHVDLEAFSELDPNIYPGAAVYFMDGELPEAEMFPAPTDVPEYYQEYQTAGCEQVMGNKEGTDEVLICGDSNAPSNATATVILAGGSHAGHFEAAFRALGKKYGWEVLVATKSACAFGTEARGENQMCGAWNENFIQWLEENDVDLVVTPGSRQDNFKGGQHEGHEYVYDQAPYWWSRISETGTPLLLTRGTPRSDHDVPECLATGKPTDECGPTKEKLADSNPILDYNLPPNTFTIDLTTYICPSYDDPSIPNCESVVGNQVVYLDDDHVTRLFSQSLAPAFEVEMKKVVPELFE